MSRIFAHVELTQNTHDLKPKSFLQSKLWGSFKSRFGWRAQNLSVQVVLSDVKDNNLHRIEFPLLVLERRIFKFFSFAYIPHGPEIAQDYLEKIASDFALPFAELVTIIVTSLSGELRAFLNKRSFFIRFDPAWSYKETLTNTDEEVAQSANNDEQVIQSRDKVNQVTQTSDTAEQVIQSRDTVEQIIQSPKIILRPELLAPLVKSVSDIQPPDTVVLDLTQSLAEIFAGFKPKWRYNIKLAQKKAVTVQVWQKGEGDFSHYLQGFYKLYEETSKRDKITLHPYRYYASLFELACKDPEFDLRIWQARHEGEILASIITLFYNGTATYLYGASSNNKRNLMPSYVLQWAAIEAAHARHCQNYDFYGIPPSEDPNHPMAGLYRFKTGFGGKILHYTGAYDFPTNKFLYMFFSLAEKARSYYYKVHKKR